MKNFFWAITASVIVFTGAMIGPKAVKADYLVNQTFNSDFESDPLGIGWQQILVSSPTLDYIGTWGAENVHSATRSTRMGAYGGATQSISQAFEIKDKTYRIDFSFWYKVTGNDFPANSGRWAPTISYELSTMTDIFTGTTAHCQQTLTGITTPGATDLRGDWRLASCLFEVFDGKEVSPGSYQIMIKLQSLEDNVRLYVDDVTVISRTYDRIPPTLEIKTPVWGSTVNTATVTVAGTVGDQETGMKSLEYDLGGGKWTPVSFDAQGNFSATVNLVAGKNVIPFRALDRGENYTWRYYELTYKSTGQVLGAMTAMPQVSNIATAAGVLKIMYQEKQITIKPFPGCRGNLSARQIDASDGSVYYLVATLDRCVTGGIKLYTAAGKLVQTLAPFGSFKPGYNLSMTVDQDSGRVWLAVAPKLYGSTVSIFQFRSHRLKFVNSVQVTKKTLGNLRVKFLPLYSDAVGLVTIINGKPATLKVWQYNVEQHQFLQDKTFDLEQIRVTTKAISLI